MKHLLSYGIFLISASASASVWTYDDCVDYALAHNISLQKAVLDERTAAIDLDEAKAQWQPTLDFATTHGYSNTPWGEGAHNLSLIHI